MWIQTLWIIMRCYQFCLNNFKIQEVVECVYVIEWF